MKAVVIHAVKDLRIEDRDIGDIGHGQVGIAIEAGGICGSDLHYYHHGGFGAVRVKHPMVLGHEVAGTVTSVGKDVCGQSRDWAQPDILGRCLSEIPATVCPTVCPLDHVARRGPETATPFRTPSPPFLPHPARPICCTSGGSSGTNAQCPKGFDSPSQTPPHPGMLLSAQFVRHTRFPQLSVRLSVR